MAFMTIQGNDADRNAGRSDRESEEAPQELTHALLTFFGQNVR